MSLYERGLDILNELQLLPLETNLLSKDFKYIYKIPKKFNLNNESINVMEKIKDIKIIVMSNNFNTKVKFPKGVKEIVFGDKFNKEVILPKGLKKLTMGTDFNQNIKLRSSLEIINFGYKFNKLVTLPKKLKYMTLCENCNKPLIINKELRKLYYYGRKPLIYPISKEEFKNRGLELYDITLNGTSRYKVNHVLLMESLIENYI
jgi:hypothetical protein